jgi:hypothetical protein
MSYFVKKGGGSLGKHDFFSAFQIRVCRGSPPNTIYNFETWGQQAADFIREKVGEPSVIICNSVGGLAGLQAAREDTKLIKAVQVKYPQMLCFRK